MVEHAYLIPLLPFLVSLVILFFFDEDAHSPYAPYLGIATMFWCLVQSLVIFHQASSGAVHPWPYEGSWEWFSFAADSAGKGFSAAMPIGILIDGAAAVMLVVVTLVSLLVQVYSLGYMHGDPRFKRYYAYLSFFTASMLGLVVSNNLLVTFACWELVGVSSYLLIGFWFEKPAPAYASKKAFMTTKLGDCGLYVALLLIWAKFGSFKISMLAVSAATPGVLTPLAATAIGLGILCGAAGKSAQWPLFIWLPDAMEGPTPVSALIHAATMVAAGIYLVAKTYFIYAASPVAMEAVAWIGLITALLAATMALVAYDIKRVLAFSTVSQLGFMLCALGCGGYTAGLFHLTTHAFFKALLFLGAGSVIHSVHTNDMRQMGGLSKKMPVTFGTMFVATLAIAGIWPFAGYFSKDMILERVYGHNQVMFGLLTFAALLTAFYMFRMIFLTFVGDDRDHERHHHAHESPWVMLWPLCLLAFLSVVSGAALAHNGFFEHLVNYKLPEGLMTETLAPRLMPYAVTALVCGSIALSWFFYGRNDFTLAESLKARCSPIFSVLENRYGFDAIFLSLVAFSDRIAKFAFWFDSSVIDQFFVDGWGLITRICAELSGLFDNLFVDRTVDGFGGLSMDAGVLLRSLVTHGQVQEYLMYIAVAVSLFTILILSR
ncbi:MAG: NADH-quinone oxidoreductase subunit L [Elusimicrobia bacterium]|nr:NADH-quinone oxidoreductase subunit L [Elusimicrobiota bacterium]